MHYLPSPILSFVAAILLCSQLSGQNVLLEMSSSLSLSPQREDMVLPEAGGGCATYLFDQERIFDAPDKLEIYNNSKYVGRFEFLAFLKNQAVEGTQLDELKYSIKVNNTGESFVLDEELLNFQGHEGFFLIVPQTATSHFDTLNLNLQNSAGKTLAQAQYYLRVLPEPQPGDPITIQMPYKNKRLDTRLTTHFSGSEDKREAKSIKLEEEPVSIRLNEGESAMLVLEMSKTVSVGEKSGNLAIGPKQNYGYHAEYRWEGASLPLKRRLDNGLVVYLSAAPPTFRSSKDLQIESNEPAPAQRQRAKPAERAQNQRRELLERTDISERQKQRINARINKARQAKPPSSTKIRRFTLHIDFHDEFDFLFDTKTVIFEVPDSGK